MKSTNGSSGRSASSASRILQFVEQRLELDSLGRIEHIIGIQPERIVPLCPRERRVAGRGEVTDPDEIEHPGPELAGDLPRAVGAARIDDHDLVEQVGRG